MHIDTVLEFCVHSMHFISSWIFLQFDFELKFCLRLGLIKAVSLKLGIIQYRISFEALFKVRLLKIKLFGVLYEEYLHCTRL